jgi:uncharacterized phage-like protein YoqJ
MRIAATGHRPNKLGNEYNLKGPYSDWIRDQMRKVIEDKKPERLISGMALGVDTIWALLAIEMKIPLTAAIPFVGQENKWRSNNVQLYRMVLDHPGTTVVNVSGFDWYNPRFMHIRNEWMVDNSDLLVAVWNGTAGGTMSCVAYAKRKHRAPYRIDPEGWREEPRFTSPARIKEDA